MLAPTDYFDLKGNRFAGLFEGLDQVWEAFRVLPAYVGDTIRPNVTNLRIRGDLIGRTMVLHEGEVLTYGFTVDEGDVKRGGLKVYLGEKLLEGATVIQAGAVLASDQIELGRGTLIESGAMIKGPTIIGDRTEVRQGAYIRGKVLVGDECVVGHVSEMKATVMLGGSQAGHFAYLGDSILGKVNLGAGTKLANLKVYPGTVSVMVDGQKIDTGLRKFGAILAEEVEMGCNSVTTPGTMLGRGAVVYPNVTVRGVHPSRSVIKA